MAKVKNYSPVTYSKEKYFLINKADVTKRIFIKATRGVYYLDTNNINTPTNKPRKNSVQK